MATLSMSKTKVYKTDHTTFGGLIYLSDFNTEHRRKDSTYGSAIANRIVNDQKFDRQCIKNRENKRSLEGGEQR